LLGLSAQNIYSIIHSWKLHQKLFLQFHGIVIQEILGVNIKNFFFESTPFRASARRFLEEKTGYRRETFNLNTIATVIITVISTIVIASLENETLPKKTPKG